MSCRDRRLLKLAICSALLATAACGFRAVGSAVPESSFALRIIAPAEARPFRLELARLLCAAGGARDADPCLGRLGDDVSSAPKWRLHLSNYRESKRLLSLRRSFVAAEYQLVASLDWRLQRAGESQPLIQSTNRATRSFVHDADAVAGKASETAQLWRAARSELARAMAFRIALALSEAESPDSVGGAADGT